jgi:hypothetical protein
MFRDVVAKRNLERVLEKVTNFSNIYTGTFGLSFTDGASSDQIFLTYTAIPEPKAALLGCLGVLLLRRRR